MEAAPGLRAKSLAFRRTSKGKFMTRREVVLLVSRALAVIQLMSALLDITYLPAYLMDLFHHPLSLHWPYFNDYWSRYYTELLLAFVARIAILLFAALVLWRCGPQIEAFLLPGDGAASVQAPQA
jgi:hypothetical protein